MQGHATCVKEIIIRRRDCCGGGCDVHSGPVRGVHCALPSPPFVFSPPNTRAQEPEEEVGGAGGLFGDDDGEFLVLVELMMRCARLGTQT